MTPWRGSLEAAALKLQLILPALFIIIINCPKNWGVHHTCHMMITYNVQVRRWVPQWIENYSEGVFLFSSTLRFQINKYTLMISWFCADNFYLAISLTHCNLCFALIQMKNCSLVIRTRYLSDLGKIWTGQYIRLKPQHSESRW